MMHLLATRQVIATVELLEQILLHLDTYLAPLAAGEPPLLRLLSTGRAICRKRCTSSSTRRSPWGNTTIKIASSTRFSIPCLQEMIGKQLLHSTGRKAADSHLSTAAS